MEWMNEMNGISEMNEWIEWNGLMKWPECGHYAGMNEWKEEINEWNKWNEWHDWMNEWN